MSQRDAKLLWLHKERTLPVGVDIAKKTHWARTVDLVGLEVSKAFSFENTEDGFRCLLARLAERLEKCAATRAVVAMEPTGHYWKSLARYLQDAGVMVVLVNPYHVKRQKETEDNSPTKSDRKDAKVIADLARQGKFLSCLLPDGVFAELRVLHQTRQEQKRKLHAGLNLLHAILDEYFPEFCTVFQDPLKMTAMAVLLQAPFPQDLIQLSMAELTAMLKVASNRKVGQKRAGLLLKAAQSSVGVKQGIEAARLRLRSCLAEIQFWQDQLGRTEEAMTVAVAKTGLGQYLLSIPGVGLVTVAGFLGEVGDPARFADWRQLRKLSGLDLTENSSGKHKGTKRISKRGRPGLRCLLYRASLTLVATNPQFAALYRYLKTRNENPLRNKQALIAIACKLLRVMFHLVTRRLTYDPALVFGPVREAQLTSPA